jgi:transposase
MPAPYSIDLRQRVINAYEAKECTQRQLAERFQVSQSFVTRLIRRYQQTGGIEPLSRGGGAKAKIQVSQLEQIEKLVEEQSDVLLRELCERWEEKIGIKVSISTMHRQLQKLRLTTKKKLCMHLNKIVKESKK